MNWWIPLAFVLGLVVGGGGVWIWMRFERADAPMPIADPAPARVAPKAESNPLLIPPPMVSYWGVEMTAAQFAMRYHSDNNTPMTSNDPQYGVWGEITKRMYDAAAGDIGVFRHFQFTDMERLQRHFTATLFLVLDKGVRKANVTALEKAHKNLDITEREYDTVISVLYQLLIDYRMPQNVLDTVAEIGAALKPVIVKSAEAA